MRKLGKKDTLVYVGAARQPENGLHPGGQITTGLMLLSSPLAQHFEILVIDSTARGLPPENFLLRFAKGVKRLTQFVVALATRKPVAALIFSSSGLSFFEKTFMCLIGRFFDARCLLFIRSGHFIPQVQQSSAKWLYKWLLSIPSLLVCQSPSWSDFFVSLGIGKERCAVLPNAVQVSYYSRAKAEKSRSSEVTFLFVGWLVREKGIFDLIEAAEILKDDLPNARWILVGEGTAREELEAYLEKTHLKAKVEVTGWVSRERVLEYLGCSDIFVLPTYAEGFPNVLLEAMSAGLPVITTPVGGIPGYIRNGENGILVSPGNKSELAEAMRRLANDWNLRDALASTALRHVKDVHDVDVVFAKLEDIIINYSEARSCGER